MLIVGIAAVASLIKSTTGFGYPVLIIPVLSLLVDFVDAVLLVTPSNLVINLGIMWRLRKEREGAATLGVFCFSGVLGTVAGTLLLPWIPVELARILLLVVLAAFLVNRLSPLRLSMTETTARRYAPIVGGVSGVFQGATGISGPIITPWFLSLDRDREVFVLSISVVFGLTGISQMIVAGIDGSYSQSTISIGLLLIPVAVLSIPIGARIRHKATPETFERIVLGLLGVSALLLLLRILGVS